MGTMIEGVAISENYTLAKHLIDAAMLRHQALSSNIANLQTPGYKRVDLDVDFETKLAEQVKAGQWGSLEEARLVEDKTAQAVRPDGNNVALEEELMQINQNSLNYQFLAQYVSDATQHIKIAVTGRTV